MQKVIFRREKKRKLRCAVIHQHAAIPFVGQVSVGDASCPPAWWQKCSVRGSGTSVPGFSAPSSSRAPSVSGFDYL